jgi:Domain of unknown function (DUF4249)
MKICFKIFAGYAMGMLLVAGCKQTYDPQVKEQNVRLLVVEGFLNSGTGPTIIHLSRTVNLKDTVLSPETGAEVIVENENGGGVALTENANGEYSISQLVLDNNLKYRLHIKTSDGRGYASDYTSVKYTPAIDSISWQRENGGLRLYVNAHDPQNEAKYYRWTYSETWEFHSAFHSALKFIWDSMSGRISVVFRNPDQSADTTIYRCWNTLNSTSIILGSTEKLTSDVVYIPVQYIEPHSEKLSVLYSLFLAQYAISQGEYFFLQKMKKNTEQLGTIFDPQPSELKGNIHCFSDTSEAVVGYVDITQEQTKRIFIYNSQLADWGYDPGCVLVKVSPSNIGEYGFDLIPTTVINDTSFYASTPNCVDCTLRGVHRKPDFWP